MLVNNRGAADLRGQMVVALGSKQPGCDGLTENKADREESSHQGLLGRKCKRPRSAVDSVGVLVDSSGGNCADCEFGIHEIDLFLSGRFDFSIGRAREVPVVREASIC